MDVMTSRCRVDGGPPPRTAGNRTHCRCVSSGMTTTSPLRRAGVLVAVGTLLALAGCGTPDAAPPADPGPTTVRVEATRPTSGTSGPLPPLPSAEEVVAARDVEHPIDGEMGTEPEVRKLFPGMTSDEVLSTLRAQIRVGDVGRALGELAPADYADVGLEDGGVSPVIFMLTPRGVELAEEVARLSDLDAEVRLTTTTGAALGEASGLLQADETLQDLDLDVRSEVHGLAVDVEHDDHAAAVARVRALRLPAPVDVVPVDEVVEEVFCHEGGCVGHDGAAVSLDAPGG